MIRGVYTAASAMIAQETAQAVIANNLANVNTPGYKADIAVFEAFRLAPVTRVHDNTWGRPIGQLGAGTDQADIVLDRADGPIKVTGNNLDVAARGNQFFVVRTPQGDRLTRAGAFTLGPDGALLDTVGHPVVGADGRTIRVDGRGPIGIDKNGNVLSGGTTAAALKVVELLPSARPVKEGQRLLRTAPNTYQDVPRPRLVPGALEGSNVSIIEEMVAMIGAMRAYEAAQKAVQSEDEALGKALNEVARA